MVMALLKEKQEEHQESRCIHHWLIDTPDGPVSQGVCKYCREVKYFDNVLQDKYSSESTPRDLMNEFIEQGEEREEEEENEEEEL